MVVGEPGECCLGQKLLAQAALNGLVCCHGGVATHLMYAIPSFSDEQHPANAATRHCSYCLTRWRIHINNALVVEENCQQCLHIVSTHFFLWFRRGWESSTAKTKLNSHRPTICYPLQPFSKDFLL